LLQEDLSNGGDPFASFNGILAGQENGGLVVTTQEKVMEGSSLVDLLITCARAVEAGDFINAFAILSRLD
jgi:hypothetical protein